MRIRIAASCQMPCILESSQFFFVFTLQFSMAKLGERGKQLYFFDVDGGSVALALRSGDPVLATR